MIIGVDIVLIIFSRLYYRMPFTVVKDIGMSAFEYAVRELGRRKAFWELQS